MKGMLGGNKSYSKNPFLATFWLIVIFSIPVISYFGRPLQGFLKDTVGTAGIVWGLGSAAGFLLALSGILLARQLGWIGLLNLLWLLLVAAGLMYYLRGSPERWLHIPLFGLLGFLSVSVFSLRAGIEIALATAFLDEFFQYYLPNRVGDFEDVAINAVCAASGIILYSISRGKKSTNPQGCRPYDRK